MISKFSVKKPYTVLVGVVLAVVLGVVAFTRMTADLLPSISLPYVIVMTTYPGASPETVETVVTQPVEAAMATVSNIEGIRSVSNENYSLVILEFAQTADMNAVSLEIRESLDQISSYWDDTVGNPIIMKLNPDMLPVMIAAVGMEGMDNGDISTYVQDTIMPELESIEGVASVNGTGLLEESVNVIIRQDKVDEVNEKVFAAIDEKMAEAEQELADARQELEDGRRELLDGQRELNEGRQELEDGKKELEDGKQELQEQQDALNAQLANQKVALLAAKAQLESMQTDLATAKALEEGIEEIKATIGLIGELKEKEDELKSLAEHPLSTEFETAMNEWIEAYDNDDKDAMTLAAVKIGMIKAGFDSIGPMLEEKLPASYAGVVEDIKAADALPTWVPTDKNDAQFILKTVSRALKAVDMTVVQLIELIGQEVMLELQQKSM